MQAHAKCICEAFDGRLRDELLNETIFYDLNYARLALALWVGRHNQRHPHSGNLVKNIGIGCQGGDLAAPALILEDDIEALALKLSRLDRYELQTMSHRKFAIREFDAASARIRSDGTRTLK